MKASPTVEEIPRDSQMAQMISCETVLMAEVAGRALRARPLSHVGAEGGHLEDAPNEDVLDIETDILSLA